MTLSDGSHEMTGRVVESISKVKNDSNVNMYVVLKVHKTKYSSLAQSVEHSAVNRSVVGSSPTGGA